MPQLEVSAAMQTPGKLAVIVAGSFHAFWLRKFLEKTPANIAIISPTSAAVETKKSMEEQPGYEKWPDDSYGTCGQWELGASQNYLHYSVTE